MRKIIFIVLCSLPVLSFGQIHLGRSVKEIQKEFGEAGCKVLVDKDLTIVHIKDDCVVIHRHDKKHIAKEAFIFPKNDKSLNERIQQYNKEYTVISAHLWRCCLENGSITDIELIWDEDLKTYVFLFIPLTN